MKISDLEVYKCPACQSAFTLITTAVGDEITTGEIACPNNHSFNISDGLPDFTWPKELADIDQKTKDIYNKLASEYDKFASIPFQTFLQDEMEVRDKMTEKLNLQSKSLVLEIGGGDGRGTQHIIKRLSKEGKLYFQELSPAFLLKAKERLKEQNELIHYSIANASYLSFEDNYFDGALHFGGINTFAEIQKCLKELARVVKPGGKIVVGDEGIGPWLRETEFGKIMINSNPLIGYKIPFECIPVEARDVKIEWIMMGAFFLLEFTVGEGEPKPNYHIPIPSERGGTHWSRYFGQLEGISDETKKLAKEAQLKSGKSMAEWLDDVVKQAVQNHIKDNNS